MNTHTSAISRLFRRGKRNTSPAVERVSGVYLQEQLAGANPGDQTREPSLPAESVLAECHRCVNGESAAAPLFVP